MLISPTDDLAFVDRDGVDVLRRRFQTLHSSLRDAGHNPIEAVSLLADTLAPNGHPRDARISKEIDQALRDAANRTTAAAVAVAFQQFIVSQARNGLGQYLTPLPVAEMIARLAASAKPASLLDPFAGSGLLLEQAGARLDSARLHGIEINPTIAQIARAVSRLADRPIDVTDGDAFLCWTQGSLPTVDAVITNPPFGSIATRANRDDLRRVGASERLLALRALPAELLGLELSVAALREGGFLAIVLPQSVLTNAGWAGYRSDLFGRVRVSGVVSLPEETFGPFRGVAKACVLFGVKDKVELPVTFPYVRSRSVGYDDTGRTAGRSDLGDAVDVLLHGAGNVPAGSIDAQGKFHMPLGLGLSNDPGIYYALGDIADIFTGRTLGRGEYTDAGPRVLKVGDLSGSFISWRSRQRTRVPQVVYERNARARLRKGDICLTAAAHKPRYVGLKVDLIDELPAEGAMASAEVMVIRLRPDAPVRPEHVLFYLRSEAGYRQLQDFVRGSTAHLYPSDVTSLLIRRLEDDRLEEATESLQQAAEHFRKYLRYEAEALRIGVPGRALEIDEADV